MSWNIAKPGDQINGPVSVTGALTSSSTVTGTQIISTIATGTAPLTVASTTNVTNLNADLLDGQQGSFYQSADNINAGTLVVGRGGTGATTFTAGRVLFGNGTSALNTSANLFWDNANNRLGIGTATPGTSLDVALAGSGTPRVRITSVSDNPIVEIQRWAGAGTNYFGNRLITDNTALYFQNSNETQIGSQTFTTRLTLNSSGYLYTASNGRIGVGVVPSAEALTVVGRGYFYQANPDIAGLRLQATTGTNAAAMQFQNTGGNYYVGIDSSTGGRLAGVPYALTLLTESAQPIVFATNNTFRATIDSTGNLGLGVTPSAWASGWKAFDVGNTGSVVWPNNNSALYLLANSYYNGTNWIYKQNAQAGLYLMVSGQHQWHTAASGIAGNAISFTQSMTLDASGNLGLGVSSLSPFVGNLKAVIGTGSGVAGLTLYGGNATFSVLLFADGTTGNETYRGFLEYNHSTDSFVIGTAGANKVWLDASGNLCVGTASAKNTASGRGNVTIEGTSSAILNLSVNNSDTGYLFHDGTNIALDNKVNGYVRFSSNNTERLRIKATGQLNFTGLAADPASPAAGDVYYNSSTNKLRCYNGTTWNDLF